VGDALLSLKQILFVWLLVGNGILFVWAVGLYLTGRPTGPLYFRLVAFMQILVLVVIGAGVFLFVSGVATTWGHLLYAVLNAGLAVGRLLAHGRLVGMGKQGLLWQMFLALLAIALVARSSVTAYG